MSKMPLSENKEYHPLGDLDEPNLICAFSSRSFNNMSLSYGDTRESLNNRKDFLASLGIDYRSLVCARQIHGSNIMYVQESDKGKGALSCDTAIVDIDGFITDKKNLPLAIFTADCLPVFLYDPNRPAIGLIHAGWRSTKEHISAKAVELMQKKFATKTENLYVGFGPAIRDCCYEVGREFDANFAYGIKQRDSHYYLDLAQINKRQILGCGVRDINMFDVKICTSCRSGEFFSYRRERNSCGRMMSVMMLK